MAFILDTPLAWLFHFSLTRQGAARRLPFDAISWKMAFGLRDAAPVEIFAK
jgi:hypothetical protein